MPGNLRHWSLFILSICVLFLGANVAQAQAPLQPAVEGFVRARIEEVASTHQDDTYGFMRTVQQVRMRLTSGPGAGEFIDMENGVLPGREDMQLQPGEMVILRTLTYADGHRDYLLAEKYRLPALGGVLLVFIVLIVVLSGWTGLRSLVGLGVSIAVLTFGLVPAITHGWNPLLAAVLTAICIACTSLYLAHGCTWRTTVALISTLVTLLLSILMAILAVRVAHLFGMGSEESVFLQSGALSVLNLRGLLLGGIVIGCMGVLDDITTAQTATVDEIRRANPRLSTYQLAQAGASVGREHIASLINTLALAYVSASLPLLLLFQMGEQSPLWVILNNESLAEEFIRTVVGSATLLFAVPISTWFAIRLLPLGPAAASSGHLGHHH